MPIIQNQIQPPPTHDFDFLPEIRKNSPTDRSILSSWANYFDSIGVDYTIVDHGPFYTLYKSRIA